MSCLLGTVEKRQLERESTEAAVGTVDDGTVNNGAIIRTS